MESWEIPPSTTTCGRRGIEATPSRYHTLQKLLGLAPIGTHTDPTRAFAGGPHPRGDQGEVPSLLDLEARGRYSSIDDLTLALQFGETLGYDKLSSGGMADVQMNLAMLPEDDQRAIAEYLLSLR